MSLQWSGSGLDLHLVVDRAQVGRSLEAALRTAIRAGTLEPGSALPSSRALATDLGVARNTVVEVYDQLVAEGWITARPGSKTRVTDRAMRPPRRSTVREMRLRPPSVPLDLRPGAPDTAAFPRKEWLAASKRALRCAPDEAFGYGDPRGLPHLRDELARYLSRVRGVDTAPEQIVVTLGITHAVALVARVLAQHGATSWALERHGLPIIADVVSAAGLAVQHIEVDRNGAVIGSLGGADAVSLTPAHQFPLGVTLSAARRREVVSWAQTHDGLIIEDDYDGEYRYDRQPVGSLQALDPDRVLYLGTTSKSLAPGLRLGWLAAPAGLVPKLMKARTLGFGYNSSFDQLTLAELLRSGDYDRLVRRSRAQYRRRRDQLIEVVTRHGLCVEGTAAGLHALVTLPAHVQEAEVIARAERHGLTIEGLRHYAVDAAVSHAPALVLGYGAATDDTYGQCLLTLSEVLATLK